MTKQTALVAALLAVPATAFGLGPQDLAELRAASVPEIDAFAGFAAIGLVGATLALIRARRG